MPKVLFYSIDIVLNLRVDLPVSILSVCGFVFNNNVDIAQFYLYNIGLVSSNFYQLSVLVFGIVFCRLSVQPISLCDITRDLKITHPVHYMLEAIV